MHLLLHTPREPGTIVKLSRAHALLLQFVGKTHSMVFFGSQWISCCKLLEKQSSIMFFCSQQIPCCNLLESKGSICLLTTVVSFAMWRKVDCCCICWKKNFMVFLTILEIALTVSKYHRFCKRNKASRLRNALEKREKLLLVEKEHNTN